MFSQHQWLKLSIILLIALLARMAMGAPSRVPANRQVVRETIQTRTQSIDLSVGPGVVVQPDTSGLGQGSTAGFALVVGATTPISATFPLHVGIETGLDFWSPSQNVGVKGIRLLGTAYYKFGSPRSVVRPYVGLLIGPNITIATTSFGLEGFGIEQSQSQTKVFFELLSRTGVAFDLSPAVSLWVEPRFGLLSDQFAFMAVSGLAFAL